MVDSMASESVGSAVIFFPSCSRLNLPAKSKFDSLWIFGRHYRDDSMCG